MEDQLLGELVSAGVSGSLVLVLLGFNPGQVTLTLPPSVIVAVQVCVHLCLECGRKPEDLKNPHGLGEKLNIPSPSPGLSEPFWLPITMLRSNIISTHSSSNSAPTPTTIPPSCGLVAGATPAACLDPRRTTGCPHQRRPSPAISPPSGHLYVLNSISYPPLARRLMANTHLLAVGSPGGH